MKLLKLVQDLNEEQQRVVREGLGDEETLVLFDLLHKPNLTKAETDRIKRVAQELHNILQAEVARVQDFFAKQTTRAAMKIRIRDFLWDENTGLPENFDYNEIEVKIESVLAYVIMATRNGSAFSGASSHIH